MSKNRFYFDYAASTPVAPQVLQAMRPYFLKKFGNAGSLHSFGQEAVAAMDSARETIVKAIGAEFREVVFTGSATEANNLAIRGVVKSVKRQESGLKKPKFIISAIEHESILETARDLEREGIEVVMLPVTRDGVVKLDELKSALNEQTLLVSVMYANNEIGSIQPIAEISEIIRNFREEAKSKNKEESIIHNSRFMFPLFHTDAVQAFQFLDCDVHRLGVDLMTFSSHKIYGPKGIGALYVRKNAADISPIITGGGQEFGLRSGTENIPLIVGFAKAVELANVNRGSEFQRIKKLKNYFWNGILKMYPEAELNGAPICLPNILNVYFPDYEAQYLLAKFDLAGIAVSTGSACSARSAEPSYVVKALGYSEERAKKSIRFSFGRPTTQNDIDSTLKVIRKLL